MLRTAGHVLLLLLLTNPTLLPLLARSPKQQPKVLRFEISFARELSAEPLDGRVLLMISTDGKREPRLQFFGERTLEAQQIFGVDADGLQPEQATIVDGSVLGFPMKSLDEIHPGDYFVQALLNRYTTFH